MKKVLLGLILITALACKSDKKETTKQDGAQPKKELVATKVNVPDYNIWGKTGTELTETTELYAVGNVQLLSRTKEQPQSSLAHSGSIEVNYGETYRASILAKKGTSGNLFGLRISGSYPDRVDAVFNLEEGIVMGVKKGRDFENESADIEDLGDGWYKCSVTADVTADEIYLMFGPTTDETTVSGWESKTTSVCSTYIVGSSLTLEKLSFE